MRDERFEWDDAKADANIRKHGVTFEDTRRVFDDPNALMESHDDTDETRDLTIGVTSEKVLFVVSTERGDRIRIISARRATRHEQDHYYRQAHP
jgi:uncharacterized protein